MKKPTIALCMIIKNDTEEILGALKAVKSVESAVDKVYLTLNGQDESLGAVAQELNDTGYAVSYKKWTDDFSEMRNFNFSQATEDWILWLDADDVVKNPENVKKLVAIATERGYQGYFAKYLYDKDEKGRVTTWHWKIRLVKNDGHTKWAGRIHEDLLQQRKASWIKQEDFLIDHQATETRRANSVVRNLSILMDEVKKQGENPDPRTLFYIGTAYMQLNDPTKAREVFERYLELSGWDEERYEVYQRLGDLALSENDMEGAREAYVFSILERPENPEAYFNLARVSYFQENWAKCIEYSRMGFKKPAPDSNVLQFPQKLTWQPMQVYATALMYTGKFLEAITVVDQALQYAPDEETLKTLKAILIKVQLNKEFLKFYVRIAKHLKEAGQSWRLPGLITSVPTELQDNVIITKLKDDLLPSVQWSEKSIVFYCGMTAEPWSPKSLDGKGIGGSETAVIHLAKRLAKEGHEVTVFNWCHTDEGEYDGVTYKNYWSFKINDSYNILVLWRDIGLVDTGLKARKIYVDLHDVPNANEFTKERVGKVEKILVKSEYHRNLLQSVVDEKITIIPNGIDVSRYETPETREPASVIYSSAPNRGLDILLNIWPKVREAVPTAVLRVFYGWKTFFELQKDNPASMKWMQKIQAQMLSLKDSGVMDMGRVSQKELAEWQKKSAVWAYPTYFPEISCITAMEVQAAGCVPVCTDYAALAETAQYGERISGDIYQEEKQKQFLEKLIEALTREHDTVEMEKWAKDTYSWDTVAKRWNEEITK